MPAEITMMEDIEPERFDGVGAGANGFPILMLKAVEKDVNAVGGINEKPDIAGAQSVLCELARLIEAEARELAVGASDEIYDIQLLTEASCLMECFLRHEQYGDEDDGAGLGKAEGQLTKEEIESAAEYLAKRKISTADRKRLASEGKALPDGSYPIENEGDLHNAAILARSGHGDVPAAKRLIAKRAKELGVANPLADDAKKDAEDAEVQPEAPETPEAETPEVTKTSEESPQDDGQPAQADVVKEAVAEAIKSYEEQLKAVQDELAKVKATPIPPGVAQTVPPAMRELQSKGAELAKAAEWERLADMISEPEMKHEYRKRAAEARKAAGVPSSS